MCTPCTTPRRLTPITHSQSSSGASTMPPPPTPALLHTTCTAPNASRARSRTVSTSLADRDVGDDPEHRRARGLEVGHRGCQRLLLDVGEDEAHAFGREPGGHGPPDAAGTPRDHRHPVPELPHRTPPETPPETVGAVSHKGRPGPSTTSSDICLTERHRIRVVGS